MVCATEHLWFRCTSVCCHCKVVDVKYHRLVNFPFQHSGEEKGVCGAACWWCPSIWPVSYSACFLLYFVNSSLLLRLYIFDWCQTRLQVLAFAFYCTVQLGCTLSLWHLFIWTSISFKHFLHCLEKIVQKQHWHQTGKMKHLTL